MLGELDLTYFFLKQARKLQDAQAEKLTSLQANKLTSWKIYKLSDWQMKRGPDDEMIRIEKVTSCQQNS